MEYDSNTFFIDLEYLNLELLNSILYLEEINKVKQEDIKKQIIYLWTEYSNMYTYEDNRPCMKFFRNTEWTINCRRSNVLKVVLGIPMFDLLVLSYCSRCIEKRDLKDIDPFGFTVFAFLKKFNVEITESLKNEVKEIYDKYVIYEAITEEVIKRGQYKVHVIRGVNWDYTTVDFPEYEKYCELLLEK